jgi:hypothetical protein
MRGWKRLALIAIALTASGCVASTLQENAALRAQRPQALPGLSEYVGSNDDFPSAGGDILRGTSPADLAIAREAAVPPLGNEPPIPKASPPR